jgi:hypothetical protein
MQCKHAPLSKLPQLNAHLLTLTLTLLLLQDTPLVRTVIPTDPQASLQLSDLPGPALILVLQKLDSCSRASTAVSCKALNNAGKAAMKKLAVHCSTPATLKSFTTWLEQNSTSLTSLQHCSITGALGSNIRLGSLPGICPQLRQLRLENIQLQVDAARGGPGVLSDCTGLSALELQSCQEHVEVGQHAGTAAIAVMSQLQTLKLAGPWVKQPLFNPLPTQLQPDELPMHLTQLSLDCCPMGMHASADLSQLSALVNLAQLTLSALPYKGVPGGLPPLVELTCLDVEYAAGCDASEQLQHFGSLTALQKLSIICSSLAADDVSAFEYLDQLTSLTLQSRNLDFSTAITNSWPFVTALQRLALKWCTVQSAALEGFTRLQALSLRDCGHDDLLHGLLPAVSKLSSLAELTLTAEWVYPAGCPPQVAAAAFAALTASTNLGTLQLCLWDKDVSYVARNWVLFRPGFVYPHLHVVDLAYNTQKPAAPLSPQQLQHLCSCCPAVERLSFALTPGFPSAALLPLLQLTQLTCLEVYRVGSAMEVVCDIASQMTQLKQLKLLGSSKLADPSTICWFPALSRLEVLELELLKPNTSRKRPDISYLQRVRLQRKVRLVIDSLQASDTYYCRWYCFCSTSPNGVCFLPEVSTTPHYCRPCTPLSS